MTDLSQALTLLAHRFPDARETADALAVFKKRFADNALVIDKWFAIQATIPGASTLDRVRALMSDPLFNASNPNRVRSLVGTFAFANATGFNRIDGEGYRFLARQILDIDTRNPQLAARILTSMRSWRSLEKSGPATPAARSRKSRVPPTFPPMSATSSTACSKTSTERASVPGLLISLIPVLVTGMREA